MDRHSKSVRTYELFPGYISESSHQPINNSPQVFIMLLRIHYNKGTFFFQQLPLKNEIKIEGLGMLMFFLLDSFQFLHIE